MPDDSMSIEDVLIAISEQVGGLNIKSASRMNRALIIFLKEVLMVDELKKKQPFRRIMRPSKEKNTAVQENAAIHKVIN